MNIRNINGLHYINDGEVISNFKRALMDMENIVFSFNDVHKIREDEIQLGFLKLLKGLSMRNEAYKYGMKLIEDHHIKY